MRKNYKRYTAVCGCLLAAVTLIMALKAGTAAMPAAGIAARPVARWQDTMTHMQKAVPTAQQSNALQEWKDRKYSMFIHWGAIYSTLGGVWEGKPVTRGYSEQIQSHAGIFSDVYAAVAKQFNPQYWNADSVVLLAKAAGMRSVVITSKHHDGFCMYHSAYTDYNIVDATPFKRDIVKELADACRRHGLKFGFYFSLIDWHFPQAYPISSHNSDPVTPEHHAYNKAQIRELCTNYGPVSELWFDMGSQTEQQSRELADLVHSLQPDCMVSGRLGNDAGDFCVMGDNNYPDYKIATPWQTPASVYDETWGYRSWQQHGKPEDKAREKLEGLIKVAARGGNYLLNIGPRGDGSVVAFEKDVLLRIGNWLERNGEAVYGTGANPFDTTFAWGEITTRPGRLYLHLLQQPENNRITLPGLKGRIKQVTLLENGQRINSRITGNGNGQTIQLPDNFVPDGTVKVLQLDMSPGFIITPTHVLTLPLVLDRQHATPHYSFSGVDYNGYYRSTVARSWSFRTNRTAKYTPVLTYSKDEAGQSILLTTSGQQQEVRLNGKDAIALKNNPGDLQWGPVYLNGAYTGGIDGAAPAKDIDLTRPWPGVNDHNWVAHKEWKNDSVYTLPSDRDDNWFILQEITAATAQPYLISLTSGDGIQVFLNGEEQLVHNNPERGTTQQELLLLSLRQGRNQLLLKLHNGYAKQVSWGIGKNIPQVMYRQALPAQTFRAGEVYNWQVQPARPVSVHRAMRLPNLQLHFNP